MARTIPVTDLVFLWADRKDAPANVGVVLLFEPPRGLSASRAVAAVLRAYRATPPTPPFDVVPDAPALGIGLWRRPADLDMRHHVRRESLPAPGTMQQLNERLAELHRDRLDRRRPLFEIHLIDGLESGRFALYVKSHHVSWDGRSALARIFGTLGTEPGPVRPGFHAVQPATPAAPGAGIAGGLHSLASQATALRELYAAASKRVAELRESRRPSRRGASGNEPFAGPHTRFNRPVVAERTFGQFSVPLADLRRVGHSFGGTINDALLAVVDEGVHRYLAAEGERPAEPLVAMCPVSLRDPGDVEASNKSATLFVRLGKPRSRVGRRLAEIVASTRSAKAEMKTVSREASFDFALIVFGLWVATHALGLDPYTRPAVNYCVSNVGGVDGPRYLGRSRLVGAYPVSMVADPVGLNFTTLSHDDRMDVGIVASRPALPDARPLIDHCLAAWRDLLAAKPPQGLTLRKPPARKRSRTRRIPATQRS